MRRTPALLSLHMMLTLIALMPSPSSGTAQALTHYERIASFAQPSPMITVPEGPFVMERPRPAKTCSAWIFRTMTLNNPSAGYGLTNLQSIATK